MKRPFTLKTDNISSKEIKECALDLKEAENVASEIAKMFVKYGKMSREGKQLLKEADKILSECGKSEKYVETIKKYNAKVDELDQYYKEIIMKV